MTATDELRRLLDERGVEWERGLPTETIVREPIDALYVELPDGRMHVYFRGYLTPEQAVAATLGPRMCREVYLVETSDDLIESWYPIGVYLNSKAAGDCAEALRGEVDGMRQFARVVELKVVDDC